jgi:hypothetical protein
MDPTAYGEPDPISLERQDREGPFHSIREIWLFVRTTGKWWLVPVLLALLLLGALVLLSGTGYAPFIYTLF